MSLLDTDILLLKAAARVIDDLCKGRTQYELPSGRLHRLDNVHDVFAALLKLHGEEDICPNFRETDECNDKTCLSCALTDAIDNLGHGE